MNPGESGVGSVTTRPTSSTSTTTQRGDGAGFDSNIADESPKTPPLLLTRPNPGQVAGVPHATKQVARHGTGANPRLLLPESSPHSLVSLVTSPAR